MICANLREISRSFICESLRLRSFVRGVNAKKELLLGLICMYKFSRLSCRFFYARSLTALQSYSHVSQVQD